MDNIWTIKFLGMDMRQLALYLVTIIIVLMIITIFVKGNVKTISSHKNGKRWFSFAFPAIYLSKKTEFRHKQSIFLYR